MQPTLLMRVGNNNGAAVFDAAHRGGNIACEARFGIRLFQTIADPKKGSRCR